MNQPRKAPRTLIIKQAMDVFGAWQSSRFSTLAPRQILDTFLYKSTLWEMTMALEADWAVIPVIKENAYTEYVRNLSHAHESLEKFQTGITPIGDVDFSKYDLVIALEPFLNDDILLKYPNTRFMYLRHEHANDEYQRDLVHPIGYYHAFMDHMCGAANPPPHPHWALPIPYMRAPDVVRTCFPRNEIGPRPRVFIEPRTIILAVKKDSQDVWTPACDDFLTDIRTRYDMEINTRSVQHSRFYAVTEDGSSDGAAYYGTLAAHDYYISLNAAGAGQALADAASTGAMCIGNQNLIYHRMVIPDLCMMEKLDEALEFVIELHRNPMARQNLRRTQDAHIAEFLVRRPMALLNEIDPLVRIPKPRSDSYKQLDNKPRTGVVEMGFPRKAAT
jgi:hypothetical protein